MLMMQTNNEPGVDSVPLIGLFLAALFAFVPSSCLDSVCHQDADCSDGTICIEATGQCVQPECTSHSECREGLICEEYICLEGCLSQDDCGANEQCYNNRCLEVSACNCPLAPNFCQDDLNPLSETGGEEICLPSTFPNGVALFFGSVYCGICRSNYDALLALQAELEADGTDLDMIFVHSTATQAQSADVESLLSCDSVVVQDTAEINIKVNYSAGSYDFIVVDAVGCISAHLEHVTATDVEGDLRDDIIAAWTIAAEAECEEE